jgi:hypothetical protein
MSSVAINRRIMVKFLPRQGRHLLGSSQTIQVALFPINQLNANVFSARPLHHFITNESTCRANAN